MSIPIPTVDLADAGSMLNELAASANAGRPTVLTRDGIACAAIVSPDVVLSGQARVRFLTLRGSGKGLWDRSPADWVEQAREEWRDT